jgi:DNA-binding transcriptional LysR family regulator
MNDLDHRQLRYFVAVAEELHFGRAAERLRMAQPPLSQRIAELEEKLGVKLFERTKRKVELTPAGQQLLVDARAILADLGQAALRARAAADGQSGILRIGMNYSTPLHPAPSEIFQRFTGRHPHVGLELHQDNGAGQLDGLFRRTLDLGFIFAGHDVPPDIALLPLGTDEIRLVIPKTHALAGKAKLAASDLRGQTLFLVKWQTRTVFYDALAASCRREGFELEPRTDIIQIPFIMNIVAAGQGITFVPAFLERIQPPGTVFRPIAFLPQKTRLMPLCLAYRKHDISPLVRNFIASIRNK